MPRINPRSLLTLRLGTIILIGFIGARSAPPLMSNLEVLGIIRRSLSSGLSALNLPIEPKGPRQILWAGLGELARGDGERASALLEQGVLEYPDDSMIRVSLGRAYESVGKLGQAVAEWRQARAWNEMILSAERSIQAKRWDDALYALAAAQQALPEEVVSYQARALNGKKSVDTAVSLLRNSLQTMPSSSHREEWLIFLGDYLREQGKFADAVNAYRDATQLPDGRYTWSAYIRLGLSTYLSGEGSGPAIVQVNRGISLAPEKPDGYTAMGDILRKEKRYTEADYWFRLAADRNASDVWIQVRRIENFLDDNQMSAALDIATRATEIFPAEPHPWYELGQIYEREGKIEAAITAAKRSVELDHVGNAGYRVALAGLYEQANQLTQAIDTLRQALLIDEKNGEAHVALGRILYKAGYGAQAADEQLREAIEIDPGNPAPYTELGRVYQGEKKYAEAEIWYKQAVDRSPSDPWPWVMRGENALLANNTSLAIQVLKQATAQFPNFAHSYLFLAQAYRQVGDSDRAVSSIEKAVELSPNGNVWYWVTAGQIYEWAKQSDKALKAYETALTMDPANSEAEKGIERLKR
ncbi:MAG: tetratricopeptide repeat protein [Chloroflexi bacterium]|nr:tetratricopeptide repeat protein [Chloroflexota bacterium]